MSEKIGQLKLKSNDGKYRLTDVCDIEEMFRIIESIPSKNAEPIKMWLASLGKERINDTFNPSIAMQRAIDLYRKKGYDEEWISKRIKTLQKRKELTDVWKENGIEKNTEYAILTNEIYKTWSGMTAKEYKQYKGLKENIKVAKIGGNVAKVARDNLETNLEESIVTKENRLNYKYKDDNLIETNNK